MDLWEEIDRLTSPPAPDQGLTNFGWPCYEGGPSGNIVHAALAARPKKNYTNRSAKCSTRTPSQVTAPFFAYPHPKLPATTATSSPVTPATRRRAPRSPGSPSTTRPAVPADDLFPAEYHGALFFSDAARGCIWMMEEGAGGGPDPSTVANFAVKRRRRIFHPGRHRRGPRRRPLRAELLRRQHRPDPLLPRQPGADRPAQRRQGTYGRDAAESEIRRLRLHRSRPRQGDHSTTPGTSTATASSTTATAPPSNTNTPRPSTSP